MENPTPTSASTPTANKAMPLSLMSNTDFDTPHITPPAIIKSNANIAKQNSLEQHSGCGGGVAIMVGGLLKITTGTPVPGVPFPGVYTTGLFGF
ncbi:5488_t:CDS:2 [Paraglomus brasilianum]|uniref:5488_t:CDS:1 n=1 Tax=Paraglomus brasilianum TaxID=144538 RepID=A0A9N9BCJ9_9GLOM|nr:5488_t:CDS:2 [Paraglomus brasilianum]